VPITPQNLAEGLESTADPAFAVDGEGKITVWNSAAETAFGHSREWVLGRPCSTVLCGRDAFGIRVCRRECLVFRSLREGSPIRRFRMHVRVGAGHYVEVECSTLCAPSSSTETAVIHLLRLWPGHAHRPASRGRNRDTEISEQPRQSLTPREVEVLGLLAVGKKTREMANDLGVSPATVRTHVENILRKLGVHGRLEAVVVATREGLL
jgi:PAS domain S-box-containing protein